jgi:hypothetical protein
MLAAIKLKAWGMKQPMTAISRLLSIYALDNPWILHQFAIDDNRSDKASMSGKRN